MEDDTEDVAEFRMRLMAIQLAQVSCNSANGFPEELVSMARSIYLFLTCDDPILDRSITEEEESNVVYIEEFLNREVEGD